METEIGTEEIDAASNESAAQNITEAEALEMMLGKPAENQEAEEEEVTEEIIEESEESEAVSEESEESEEYNNVLSQLDSLDEEGWREIQDHLKSNAASRIADLVKRSKSAEARAAELESKLQENSQDPLESNEQIKDNPYDKFDTIEKLRDANKNNDLIIDWADDIIFEADGLHNDDVAAELDGKEYTLRQVKQELRKAKKAKEKYIPDQLRKLQTREASKVNAGRYNDLANKELGWLKDKESDAYKAYEAVVNGDMYKTAIKNMGEQSYMLEYLLKHAINSKIGFVAKKQAPKQKSQETRKSPPAQPNLNTVQQASSSEQAYKKKISKLQSQLNETGSGSDALSLLTALEQNRKK